MRQAVILAGGRGTRLQARLNGRPKPLVDIDGVPLLRRQVEALHAHGVDDVVLLVNHAADQIEAFFAEHAAGAAGTFPRVTLIDDGAPRGTAGALLHAFDHLAERFLVVYGDTLFDVDVARLWHSHCGAGADATLFLHPNDHPFDSDLVEIDDDGVVLAMHRPPHDPGACLPNLVNAALYVMERAAVAFWRDRPAPSDIARDLFPAMLARGAKLRGYVSFEYIKDIGTPKRLDQAVAALRGGTIARSRLSHPQKAVFVDRDGTINQPAGYLARAEGFELISGAAEAVRRLNGAEYRVVVTTNQPVIARGEATVAELRRIHGRMQTLLGQDGAFLDRIYYCPHHPDGGFPGEIAALKRACTCRKPEPGLIDQAVADLNIDLAASWVIGDSTADIAMARRRGVRAILVKTGEGGRDGKYDAPADFVVADLAEAANLILDRWPALLAAAQPMAAQCGSGDVVLIGGLARSGKSSLASALACLLHVRGLKAILVPLDHWIRSEADREPGLLGRYDLPAAERAVAALAAGRSVLCPAYDALNRTSRPGRHALGAEPGSVIIVEGCPALLSAPLVAMAARKIYVACPEEVRMRRFADAYQRRGADAEAIEALYRVREDDEHPLIRAGAGVADQQVML